MQDNCPLQPTLLLPRGPKPKPRCHAKPFKIEAAVPAQVGVDGVKVRDPF